VLIPGDMSSAALLIASTISSKGKIKIKGMNFTLPQADSHIIEILKKMGISFKVDPMDDYLLINGDQEVKGGEFNLSDCPDLLPVLSILALKAKSEVSITGIKHARYKETDRIHVIANELSKTGAIIKELAGGLIIRPSGKLRGCHLNSRNDHRLFMSFCAYAIGADNTCTVEGLESVDVSYPKFIGDLKSLGAKIEVQ
jgi:3-phosphoshikimate 1-carboxyvinyltransferase